jgi:DNA-nicking Smr family endonuclease
MKTTRTPRRQTPPVAAEDAALFRDAIGSVSRVTSDLSDARPAPPPPVPRQRLADDEAVKRELLSQPLAEMELEIGDPLSYVRDGIAPRLLRRLGRGEYSVRAELDLHQMNTATASGAIAAFLHDSRRAGQLCVKIIHGKGLRSPNGVPVLKQVTDKVLRQRGDVLAFRSARAGDGGIGAVLVLLRRAD